MIYKLSRIVEKQGKAMDVLTVKIIHLETCDNDNGERLNNHSYHLGCLELPQLVRELGSNSCIGSDSLFLDSLCSVSSGVWDCTFFTRMASYSCFSWMASCSFFCIV
jgi:hypothetical protein